MKHILLFSFFALSCAVTIAQNVTNVAFQRVDKEVTLTYDLSKDANIRVCVSIDGGRFYGDYIQNMAGDIGKNIKAGKGKKIIVYDLPDLRMIPYEPDSTGYNAADTVIRFSVEVDDGSVDIKVGDMKFRMMPVPGGTFTMGCTRPSGAKHNYDAEFPTHKVSVDTFYMGKFEVTQRLYMTVMGENPSRWTYNDSLPVEQVSWNDAQMFIARLSQMTGYRFRLPTEAEWEFAARGGNLSKNHVFPGQDGDPGSVAWYGMNSGNITHPVGRKKPNELGLHDMAGNVWEWCSDWYGDYSAEEQTNPRGPKHGESRILRGGSLNSPSWGCTVSDRSWYQPDYGYGFHGFRLVLDSVEEPEEE
ncbi:MAG: formylglycine-generating enzyme family protein [Bacteroidales bacterium]|nr:formylglycine-generating enzyme family protein [Bacteroidales bacterium]